MWKVREHNERSVEETVCAMSRRCSTPEGPELDALFAQLDRGWSVVDEHHLEKEYRFDDFRQALDFTNRVGEMAEEQDHHPDIFLAWGRVKVTIWTHKIDGLTESDFVFAAKTDAL